MQAVTFRSTFNKVLSILLWAGLAAAAGATLVSPGALPLLVGVPVAAAGGAALVWALLWSPRVTVDDEAVHVENVLLEHRIPWGALIHVDTAFALTLHTPGRRIRATAAPAPGQLTAFRATRSEKRRLDRLGGAGGIRPGDLPGTDSGRAAELVRGRWERLRDSGAIEPGQADRISVERRPRIAEIVAVVLGTTALVAGVLLL